VIIYVDIDETICETPPSRDYSQATPKTERIKIINNLYNEGNTIVYWTSRGAQTGVDWRDTTESQLMEWNASYHELILMKPHYDLFIDDKSINSDTFFAEKCIKNNE